MKKVKNIKILILMVLVCFMLISLTSIYSATKLTNYGTDFLTKQLIWYLVGFLLIFIMSKTKVEKTTDHIFIYYIIVNILLFLLLFFGKEINGAKCWFTIPKIGSFQPSEFMKICIILMNVKIFETIDLKHPKKSVKTHFKTFFIVIFFTLIPSILTFLEPDTGVVIICFLISFLMLFLYGIKKRIFLLVAVIISLVGAVFLFLYFQKENLFIDIFGTSFFYRMDRILDWSNKSGMQLTNATSAIKAAGIMGFGIGKTPIYIPEAHTDFIFSVFSSNTGFMGSLSLVILILAFDVLLFLLILNTNNKKYKLIIVGFLAMIMYGQIQNIAMNISLLPITGIPLPFISYGGSSLLSYMLAVSIILNYKNKS